MRGNDEVAMLSEQIRELEQQSISLKASLTMVLTELQQLRREWLFAQAGMEKEEN